MQLTCHITQLINLYCNNDAFKLRFIRCEDFQDNRGIKMRIPEESQHISNLG
jgi:hypothetical protein